MAPSLLWVSWQVVSETNPRQAVFDPGMIGGRYFSRFIEATNGDIDFVGIWFRQKGQWRAALWTERTQAASALQLSWLSRGEMEVAATERCPCHESSGTAAAAVQAMAMGDIVGLAGRLIADRTAQTTAADDWVHGQPRIEFRACCHG